MSKLRDFLSKCYNWYAGQHEMIKASIVVFLAYLFLGAIFLSVRSIMAEKSDELMTPYNNSNMLVSENIISSTIPVLGDTAYSKIFRLQDNIITLRRDHHYQLAMTFFKNYYGVTICLMLISCVGGLLLFVLINKGWAGSSYTIKVLFMALASAAIFLSLFSGVFDQQKNFEDNMLRYMNYTKTEMLIAQQISQLSKKEFEMKPIPNPSLDFSKIAKPTKFDSISIIDTLSYYRSLDSLISKNNNTINSFTDYIFTIDASKMSNISEVYQQLLNLKNMGNTDSTKQIHH